MAITRNEADIMTRRKFTYMSIMATAVALGCPVAVSAENILRQEAVSFENCLKIIETTSESTGLTPKLTADTDEARVAEFIAPDGTVVIKCDREAKQVTVLMK